MAMAGDHGALMDTVYRRQRYIYDFTRKYYLFGRDRLIAELALKPGESVVEIGCGTARNLIKMARRYPGVSFYGLDASEEMLVTARLSIARAKLMDRIQLVHGFAENLTPTMFGRTDAFDRAVFSYSLSMIPDWKQSLSAAAQAVTKTGSVHVVDFGDLKKVGPLSAKLLTAWLRLFHVSPRVEILQKVESAVFNSVKQSGHLTLLPGRYAFLWQAEGETIQSLTL